MIQRPISLRGSSLGESLDPFGDRPGGGALRVVLFIVGVMAVAVHTFSLMASRLWVYPDSIDYIVLAGGLVDRGDWTSDLFLIRPPGYPVLLAGLFFWFGSAAPFAILALQHVMVVATALLTAGTAWTLNPRPWFAVIAGVLVACGLQGLSYANLVLTETTYAFLMSATLFALVRYVARGRRSSLASGSLLAGLAYLVKPIGVNLLGLCLLSVLIRAWRTRSLDHEPLSAQAPSGEKAASRGIEFIGDRHRLVPRRFAPAFLAAVVPALLVVGPWKITSAILHAGDDTNRCLDYVLYLRAIEFDQLDSIHSDALRDIKSTVAQAVERGALPHHADFRDRATVLRAYEVVHDLPFAGSSAIMGRAAREVMREHATTIGLNTIKYAAWMLLAPDPVYRFQPGGAPGLEGKRDPQAVIYDIGTYAFGPGSWEPTLSEYRPYLSLDPTARSATATWTELARMFHRRFDAAPPLLGFADAPYSEWVLFCVVGLLLTVFSRERTIWLLLLAAFAAHLLISAFLGGPQTRYALPVQALLKLGGAWFLVELARCTILSLKTIGLIPAGRCKTISV